MLARRQEEIKGIKATREAKRKRNKAWSVQEVRVKEREKRKEGKGRRRDAIKRAAAAGDGGVNGKRQGENGSGRKETLGSEAGSDGGEGDEDSGDDWDELAREERMAKKVKKGLVDKTTFDRAFGLGGLVD